jgi:hypothetical protein
MLRLLLTICFIVLMNTYDLPDILAFYSVDIGIEHHGGENIVKLARAEHFNLHESYLKIGIIIEAKNLNRYEQIFLEGVAVKLNLNYRKISNTILRIVKISPNLILA